MRQLGKGAYGVVVTDGRLAYKYLYADGNYKHYERAWRALNALSGSGIGDDHRPQWLRAPTGFVAGFAMPLYGPTINEIPLQAHEQACLASWLVATIGALTNCGVVHRDFTPQNIARRADSGRLVLIDLDSCFLAADALLDMPESGTFCPFYSYPTDVLPRQHVNVAFLPEIVYVCMWFSAQALLNITTCQIPAKIYYYCARPTNFFGLDNVAQRIELELLGGITPGHVIAKATETLRGMDTHYHQPPKAFRVGNLQTACHITW